MKPLIEQKTGNVDYSYCRFGAEALIKLLQTIEAQIDGVQKREDIEYVHRMRVASRRIRATMPLFKDCFSKKRYEKWLNEIKKVTRFLGAARDLDVQIEFLRNYMDLLQPTEPKRGIELLLEKNIEQRTYLQSNITNGLQELKKSRVLEEIKSFCEQIAAESTESVFNLYSVRENAFWQISSKLDEFLAMEQCVHLENEILRHHEMRIQAKWLRYTMECYSPLYSEELSHEISIMKNFQDILGEMHDYDVWIERIPKSINEIESKKLMFPENHEEKQSLLKFLRYIKAKRKKQYKKFVAFWDTEKRKNSFEELRKKASAEFIASAYRIQAELANPFVKIAVIADINSNLDALQAVIKDAESQGITVFLNAGGTLGFGAYPNEVIQTLYYKNTLSIAGNFDIEVLQKKKKRIGSQKFALAFTEKSLRKSFETYLRTFPSIIEFEIAHKKLVMVNGITDFKEETSESNNAPNEKVKELANELKADIFILGNSNEQFTKKEGKTQFISPGSVGRSRNGPQAAYVVINSNPFSVEMRKVNYNEKAAADALRRVGAPEGYAQSMLRGRFLEDIYLEDKTRKEDMEINCSLMATSCTEVASKYCPDMKHSEHVRRISLEFFDALKDLHKLGNRERCWLECAAILHDIGLSQGSKGHHKNTLKIILNETRLPFTSIERTIIANIARYHRKALPINSHNYFTSLNRELKRKVRVLSSILRLADGLDFSHSSIVQSIKIKASPKTVTIYGTVVKNPIIEEQGFNKKKDFFEKIFNKKTRLLLENLCKEEDKVQPSINIQRAKNEVDQI